MKVNALKQLIKEAVKEAIREELNIDRVSPSKEETIKPSNSIEEALLSTKSTMTNEDYKNVLSFEASDAKNFFSNNVNSLETTPVSTGPKVGLDISNLDFVKKASKVLDASYQKDKAKSVNGV